MKKILLVGNSPLPSENTTSRPAAGLRTHQFASALGDSHTIQLVTIAMPECYKDGVPEEKGCISKDNPNLRTLIQKEIDDFQPDIIIGVNTFPSYIVSGLKFDVPFWADLNGWIMAEAQAQAYKLGSDAYLAHYFEMEKAVVERADKISVVSKAQGMALLGELATFGRLNSKTFGHEFVEHIPNGTEFFDGERAEVASGNLFDEVPAEAFVLAWIGGYNTWVDEQTLFKGVEAAMKKCDNLYFVSTGGSVEGLDNSTFKNFQEMIAASEYKNRFVFLGWVDTAQIPAIYKRANVGLNVDRMCIETLTGARNRINEMMKFGLPVITTLGSEIAEEALRNETALAIKSGDDLALCEAILQMHGSVGHFGENGAKYIREKCNYKFVCEPLLKWLENAGCAPDKGMKVNLGGVGKIKSGLKYLRENGAKKTLEKLWQRF